MIWCGLGQEERVCNKEINQIWIQWGNGNRLAIVEGKDEWEIIGGESR